jgi:cell shape-determining protein MreD
MAGFTAFLLLTITAILQNSVVSQLRMLEGAADLVLLVLLAWILVTEGRQAWIYAAMAGFLIGISSALPIWVPVLGYSIFIQIVRFIQRQVWQVPIWLLVISTFLGTLVVTGVEVIYLWITGTPLDLIQVLNIVILPSLVLNMLLALPLYALVGEIAKMIYPKEVDA